ncbi:MAG: hypothetical protein ACYSWU_26800 [Planctomycetota bacterium]
MADPNGGLLGRYLDLSMTARDLDCKDLRLRGQLAKAIIDKGSPSASWAGTRAKLPPETR